MRLLKIIKTEFLEEELKERLKRKNVDGESEVDFALATANNNELLEELNRRFESYIFIYDIDERSGFMWRGSDSHAVGLLAYAEIKLRERLLKTEYEEE